MSQHLAPQILASAWLWPAVRARCRDRDHGRDRFLEVDREADLELYHDHLRHPPALVLLSSASLAAVRSVVLDPSPVLQAAGLDPSAAPRAPAWGRLRRGLRQPGPCASAAASTPSWQPSPLSVSALLPLPLLPFSLRYLLRFSAASLWLSFSACFRWHQLGSPRMSTRPRRCTHTSCRPSGTVSSGRRLSARCAAAPAWSRSLASSSVRQSAMGSCTCPQSDSYRPG